MAGIQNATSHQVIGIQITVFVIEFDIMLIGTVAERSIDTCPSVRQIRCAQVFHATAGINHLVVGIVNFEIDVGVATAKETGVP